MSDSKKKKELPEGSSLPRGKRDGNSVRTTAPVSISGTSDVAKDGEAYVSKIGSEIGTAGESTASDSNKLNDHHESEPVKPGRTDPFCDPKNPIKLRFPDISAAALKIQGGVRKTPLSVRTKCLTLSERYEMEVYTKNEFTQVTGSFKERGARYTLMQLTKKRGKAGVTSASAGNHAQAMSYHGKLLKIPVTVVMPLLAPLMKISRCRGHGANVVVQGADMGEAKEIAMQLAADNGSLYVNGYDHPDVLAGQGTCGIEIYEDLPNVDAVVCPVGGGGLIAGIAVALKHMCQNVQIIGVEAEVCPSFTRAMETGNPVYSKPGSTLADGLNVPVVGVNAFATAKDLVDEMVTVSESEIARAILMLVEVEKAVVEGAGAVGLAALLAGKLSHLKGKKVVFILCGGNIDTTVFSRALDRGMAAEGRLVRFSVTVTDRPGGIAELMALLAKAGASLKDLFQERAWLKTDIFSVRVKIILETRDWDHAHDVEVLLRAKYNDVCAYSDVKCFIRSRAWHERGLQNVNNPIHDHIKVPGQSKRNHS